jgi:hypothetical protein
VLDVLGKGPGGERVVFCCFGPESRRYHEEALADATSERT